MHISHLRIFNCYRKVILESYFQPFYIPIRFSCRIMYDLYGMLKVSSVLLEFRKYLNYLYDILFCAQIDRKSVEVLLNAACNISTLNKYLHFFTLDKCRVSSYVVEILQPLLEIWFYNSSTKRSSNPAPFDEISKVEMADILNVFCILLLSLASSSRNIIMLIITKHSNSGVIW